MGGPNEYIDTYPSIAQCKHITDPVAHPLKQCHLLGRYDSSGRLCSRQPMALPREAAPPPRQPHTHTHTHTHPHTHTHTHTHIFQVPPRIRYKLFGIRNLAIQSDLVYPNSLAPITMCSDCETCGFPNHL